MSNGWWRPGAEPQPQQEQPQQPQGAGLLGAEIPPVDPNRRVILHGFQDRSHGDPSRYNRGEFGAVVPAVNGLGESETSPTWEWIQNQKPVEVYAMGDGEDAYVEKLGTASVPSNPLLSNPVSRQEAPPRPATRVARVRVEFEYDDGETVEATYHGLDAQRRSLCLYCDTREESVPRYSPRVGQRMLLRAHLPSLPQPLELAVKHLGVRHEVGEYRCIILFPATDD